MENRLVTSSGLESESRLASESEGDGSSLEEVPRSEGSEGSGVLLRGMVQRGPYGSLSMGSMVANYCDGSRKEYT